MNKDTSVPVKDCVTRSQRGSLLPLLIVWCSVCFLCQQSEKWILLKSTKNIKLSPKCGEKQSPALASPSTSKPNPQHPSLSFISVCLSLWPHCSTVSVEQLGSVRSPFSLPLHTHTITEWGRLLSLARCSVEVVIESFDQNIGGAVKGPVLAHAAALCLSIRLGWSSSCWV